MIGALTKLWYHPIKNPFLYFRYDKYANLIIFVSLPSHFSLVVYTKIVWLHHMGLPSIQHDFFIYNLLYLLYYLLILAWLYTQKHYGYLTKGSAFNIQHRKLLFIFLEKAQTMWAQKMIIYYSLYVKSQCRSNLFFMTFFSFILPFKCCHRRHHLCICS